MRFPKPHKLLFELSYDPLLSVLIKLHMASYYVGSETSRLNPLKHPRNPNSVEHVSIKRGLEKLVTFLLDREVETLGVKWRSILMEISKKLGKCKGAGTSFL